MDVSDEKGAFSKVCELAGISEEFLLSELKGSDSATPCPQSAQNWSLDELRSVLAKYLEQLSQEMLLSEEGPEAMLAGSTTQPH